MNIVITDRDKGIIGDLYTDYGYDLTLATKMVYKAFNSQLCPGHLLYLGYLIRDRSTKTNNLLLWQSDN